MYIYIYTSGDTPSPKATADTAHSAHRQHCGHTALPPSPYNIFFHFKALL